MEMCLVNRMRERKGLTMCYLFTGMAFAYAVSDTNKPTAMSKYVYNLAHPNCDTTKATYKHIKCVNAKHRVSNKIISLI